MEAAIAHEEEKMEHNYYPTRQSIESLIEKLKLPEEDGFSQDWEYEAADAERIDEFIEFYGKASLSESEKFTLMIVMIASCNDAVEQGEFNTGLWDRVKNLLVKDIKIHKQTISYWACQGEEIENCYDITPFIRGMNF